MQNVSDGDFETLSLSSNWSYKAFLHNQNEELWLAGIGFFPTDNVAITLGKIIEIQILTWTMLNLLLIIYGRSRRLFKLRLQLMPPNILLFLWNYINLKWYFVLILRVYNSNDFLFGYISSPPPLSRTEPKIKPKKCLVHSDLWCNPYNPHISRLRIIGLEQGNSFEWACNPFYAHQMFNFNFP